MAHEVNANGAVAKVRNPVAPILLSIITLGIYGAVWWYKINREMRDFGRAQGDRDLADSNPTMSVLAVTIGALVIVPPIISFIGTVGRLQRTERLVGNDPVSWGLMGGLLVLAVITGIAGLAIPYVQQDRLNKVWNRYPPLEGGQAAIGEPAQAPPPAPEAAAQPEESGGAPPAQS